MSEGPPRLAASSSGSTARRAMSSALRTGGIEDADADAERLLVGILGISRGDLLSRGDEPIGGHAPRLEAALARRLAREPVWRILGHREFYGLELEISPEVLDPRADTETVVDTVRALLGTPETRPLRILDLGTGSGAILVALLKSFRGATGVGVDRSAAALAVARRNGERHGIDDRVSWQEGDWLDGVTGPFDVVVSNPPYIPTDEIASLAPEVRDHDPRGALDGGRDGLDAYRAIASGLPTVLARGGLVALEIGETQGAAVAMLLSAAGLAVTAEPRRDLGGRPRVVIARWPGAQAT